MNKQLFLIIVICVHGTNVVHAQWTKQDSIWLQKVLSGKEQLRLNEETRKAIELGTFISTDKISPKEQMKSASSTIPITKDFSEYIKPEIRAKRADHNSMHPMVYIKYTLEAPFKEIRINKAAFAIPDEAKAKYAQPGGASFSVSFNDMLSRAFLRKERYKERNRKHANAWKNYNSFP